MHEKQTGASVYHPYVLCLSMWVYTSLDISVIVVAWGSLFSVLWHGQDGQWNGSVMSGNWSDAERRASSLSAQWARMAISCCDLCDEKPTNTKKIHHISWMYIRPCFTFSLVLTFTVWMILDFLLSPARPLRWIYYWHCHVMFEQA